MTYWWDFFAVPAYVAVLLAVALLTGGSWMTLNAVAAGYLAWVGAEWWIHRVVFHRWYRREHWVHHRRPRELHVNDAVPTLLTNALMAVTVAVALLALGLHHGSAFAAAALAGYWTYVTCHHAIHLHWVGPFTPFFGNMYRRHDLHHRGVEVNFNVLCPLGDVVMGTHKPVDFATYDESRSRN
jgi:sterol desaturase/sphingolipid hydroxylase (fatty acid hydroxylase superfamily)